ncbi:MAG: hypothetical protein BZ133_00765 [Methanosphaera sp. SHI613]|jgi:predicted metal-binding protein|nr:MAG: hypothetical protein BZ133_00765 [Methanosphaera sp. SHI613]
MTADNYSKHYNIIKEVKTLTIEEYVDNFVDFDKTLNACKSCPAYNKNWACPDFKDDPIEIYSSFEKIDLIFIRLIFDEYILSQSFNDNEWNEFLHETLFKEKDNLTEELKLLEKEYDGRYLSSGYCNICKECSKVNNNECLFPDLKRNSVESIGGLVVKITEELFDAPLKWIDKSGKVPEYLSILNALMY